ncbi:molybdopterin molybdotransferase MoeA [Metabacillus fastidiosus]|uniref:molybdopterin molybdotransferase MoeA n=1 Tax=Metabacillus fastidiosus TaxID=1458 RepID=UPI003D28A151
MEKRTPLAVSNAINKVMAFSLAGEYETVSIHESYGRYLAEDLIADHAVPPFDRSPYDGFAIRAQDSIGAKKETPVAFRVITEIGAGSVYNGKVGENEAVRIMTGAQIPDGCDAVIMLELTKQYEKDGQPFFSISHEYKKGDNISFQAEDVEKGTSLIQKGTYINPGIVALLATFGYANVRVARRPKIGIIATGSELLEVGDELKPGKIRNSNAYMMISQVVRSGAEPVYFGKLADDFDQCYSFIKEKVEGVDFLITTGGVSVGDYDYLPAIYEKLGAAVLFNKVGMRPGSVTTVAELDGKLLFGLSGNPSACYVGFELFVRPIVRTYLFSERPHLQKISAILGASFVQPNSFARFIRGKLEFENGKLIVNPVGLDKSNAVSSLAEADCLIVLPGSTRGYEIGWEVDVLLLGEETGCPNPWGE